MKAVQVTCWILLVVYTALLVRVEATGTQEDVRHYVADITSRTAVTGVNQPAALFGVNTTLCAALMWGSALLFLLCAAEQPGSAVRTERLFYWSQAAVFLYLGCDERFQIHEKLGGLLHVNDAFILLALGCAELAILLTIGRRLIRNRAALLLLLAAGFMFGVMVMTDALLAPRMYMRLSIEDLSKTWASAFLFAFAWRLRLRACHAPGSAGASVGSRADGGQ